MRREFVYEAVPARVVFGAGSLGRVPDELAALASRRVLVIAGGAATAYGDQLADALGGRVVARVDQVVPHVPEQLAADTVTLAGTAAADAVCCVGGGSATGLAKAVAVALGLPVVAVPTTYAGSEATSVYGVTRQGHKQTGADRRARVATVVYDPVLTTGLPARATAASGFNALAHAVAALAGGAFQPVARLYATAAVTTVARALPVAVREPGDLAARGDLLWAAWLAGSSLSGAGSGAAVHHRLCHVLGGRFGLVHADVHAGLLPHTVARDPALSAAGLDEVAQALGAASAAAGLQELAATVGLPRLELPAGGLPAAAAEVAGTVHSDHPHHGDAEWFRALLDHAQQGEW